MASWPTKLKLSSDCVDSCKSWQEHPSQVAEVQWKLELVVIEINPYFIFSSLASHFLLATGVNIPLEQ